MSFLNPLALIGLTLLALPVIVHLLTRRRARRLDFPTLRYLRETPSFRLHPRFLRQPLLLALRLLALLLLILGIARPLVTFRSRPHQTRVILIDASLSMSATSRADAARAEARAIINRMAQDERAAIVAFSTEASVLAETTADRQKLLAAVESYQPGSGSVDFNNALATAAALLELEAPGAAEVELISDFQQSNIDALTGERPQLNARINQHAVGASLERNAFLFDEAASKKDNVLELSASEIVSAPEGRSGARRNWTIDAGASERADILWHTEDNGQLTGRMRTLAPDDFDADDERFFAFDMPRDARVLLIESDAETSLYSSAALEAASSSLSKERSLLTKQRQLPTLAAELNSYALIVMTLHGQLSADELRALTDYALTGGTVWLSLARDADVAQLNSLAATEDGRALPFKTLTRLSSSGSGRAWNPGTAETTAPNLRAMNENSLRALRAVSVHEGYAFEPRAGADTLMRWSDGTTAFVSARLGSGSLLLFGTSSERAASDIGKSPAFPSLAFSILREAAAAREPLSYNLGETVDLGLAPESIVKITDAAGHVAQSKARTLIQTPLSAFKEAGIYRLETEKGVRYVALNTPGAESERALADAGEVQRYFESNKETLANAGGNQWREALERSGNSWRYFLGAAFLLLIAELFVRVRQQRNRRATIEVHANAASQN